jgi:hypothetical protein
MKLLSKLFALTFIVSLFVSCGGDDPVDYTLKDLNVLAGTYSGKCEISPTSINGTPYTVNPASVRLVRTQSTSTMTLETTESGLISGEILSNFKSTTDEKSYTFDIKGYSFTRINSAYIESWLSSLYSEISDIRVTIADSKDAKYVKASKTLTFSQTASADFKAKTQSGQTSNQNVKLKYNYTVVKQ